MGTVGGEASIVIDAPIERVWEVVADPELAPQWQGGLEAMTALERDAEGRATLCELEADARVKRLHSIVLFSYEPPTRLTWKQKRGQIKSLVGSWTLEALDEQRTRATFCMEGDPGRVLMVLARPVEAAVRQIMVANKPSELKRFVENSAR